MKDQELAQQLLSLKQSEGRDAMIAEIARMIAEAKQS